MTTLTDEDDIAKIANRLSAENELAAKQIAELQAENALFKDYEKHAVRVVRLMGTFAVVAGIVGGVVGWRLGADGQFEAGRSVGRMEAQRCEE